MEKIMEKIPRQNLWKNFVWRRDGSLGKRAQVVDRSVTLDTRCRNCWGRMLSFLLEKFVRRLCGRWLRNFSAENLSVSLGGTVAFEDLWLNTNELGKMMLPYEPVAAHAARLTLELPLSLSGAVTLTVDDVDVYLRACDYDVDAEVARRAVEIAVNLYWANYLRPPQDAGKKAARPPGGDAAGDETRSASALSETISSIVRSSRLVIRRVHVHVEAPLPAVTLGDGGGPRAACGLFVERISVDGGAPPNSPENVVRKTVALAGVAAYCGRGLLPAIPCDEGDAKARERRDAKLLVALRRP